MYNWEIWYKYIDETKFLGSQPGKFFKEACDNLAKEDSEFSINYSETRLTYKGYKLYSSKENAK